MSLMIDLNTCVGCGACVADCVAGCLAIEDGHAVLSKPLCISCGHCVAICPENAVSIPEYRMDLVEELSPEDTQLDPDMLQKFLSARRSIRQFKPLDVERDKLEAILETGRMTPTAANRQSLRFVVIRDQLPQFRRMVVESLNANAEAIAGQLASPRYRDKFPRMLQTLEEGGDPLYFGAPAAILVIERGGDIANGALAASRMELMAAALGLGCCFNGFTAIAAAHDSKILEFLSCGPADRIAMTFALGYPNITYRRTAPRKPLRAEWL